MVDPDIGHLFMRAMSPETNWLPKYLSWYRAICLYIHSLLEVSPSLKKKASSHLHYTPICFHHNCSKTAVSKALGFNSFHRMALYKSRIELRQQRVKYSQCWSYSCISKVEPYFLSDLQWTLILIWLLLWTLNLCVFDTRM